MSQEPQVPPPPDSAPDAPPHSHVMQSAPGPETVIDGRRFLYFAGTGYLGLQGHPDVIRGGCEALQKFGMASATSRTGFGNSAPTLDVESLAAQFLGAADCFYFISGYLGNDVLLEALQTSYDIAFIDEHAHFSVRRALKLVGWTAHDFRHRDPGDLEAQLKRHIRPGQRPVVLSDGVFPISGAIAPVADYRRALGGYDKSAIILDDAHALGTLGVSGRGTFEHAGLHDAGINRDPELEPTGDGGPSLFCCATLSKAIGGSGGVVCGTKQFIGRVKASSRYYNAASAPAHPVGGATAAALRLVIHQPQLRAQLRDNIRAAQHGLREMGLAVDDHPTPIIALKIGDAGNMDRIQKSLMARGIVVAHFQHYTGVGPDGVLRIAIFANHTPDMIRRLLDEMRRLL